MDNLTIASFHKGLIAKEFSAREAAESYFKKIARENPSLNAYLSTAETAALEAADDADARVADER